MKILVIDNDTWEAFMMLLFRAAGASADGDCACVRRCLVAMVRIINEC